MYIFCYLLNVGYPSIPHVFPLYARVFDSLYRFAYQVLAMETERFCVPELLFNPSDIGIDQAGVAETTWQSLQELNDVRPKLLSIVYEHVFRKSALFASVT